MTSLSGSAGGLGDSVLLSVGRAQFEVILPLLTAASLAGMGAAVSLSTDSSLIVLARASLALHLDLLVRTLGELAGAPG